MSFGSAADRVPWEDTYAALARPLIVAIWAKPAHFMTYSNHREGPEKFVTRICIRDEDGGILATCRSYRRECDCSETVWGCIREKLAELLELPLERCRVLDGLQTDATYPLWDEWPRHWPTEHVQQPAAAPAPLAEAVSDVATPCVLYRPGVGEPEEADAARLHFPVYRYLAEIPASSLVVGRYACLPFYNELEANVGLLGSRLINTYQQHRYVADMDYYEDLQDVTFPTWFRFEDVPQHLRDGAFVVKGRTNSRKAEWHQKMFAPNFQAAVRIGSELAVDGLIGTQGVVIRQYVPLETFEYSVTGSPVANEWRIFAYKGKLLAWNFYWGSISELDAVELARPEFIADGLPFAMMVALRVADKIPFVVIDVARTAEGKWVVVELNDGCQSGLNGMVDPDEMYAALAAALRAES